MRQIPSLVDIAPRLGLRVAGRRAGPCPACGAECSKKDRRPPLTLSPTSWICWVCGVSGQWGALLAYTLHSRPYSPDLLPELLAWLDGTPPEPQNPPHLASAKNRAPGDVATQEGHYPLADDLRRLLAATSDPTPHSIAYLTRRGIWHPVHRPPVRSLLVPPRDLERIETSTGAMSTIWPWRDLHVVVGLRDQAGRIRSIHARRIDDRTPKAIYPIGKSRRGLSMRSPAAVADPEAPVLVVEGLADYLLASTIAACPVVGIGSGSPIEPRTLAVVTHPDPAGEKYAAPYAGRPTLAADLCDLGRDQARRALQTLGVPLRDP